jgi:hypothetical protein
VFWGLCAAFLFQPWFTVSGPPEGPEAKSNSITGWQIVKGTAEGIARPGPKGIDPPVAGMGSGQVPAGVSSAVAGLYMMAAGPCLFAVGLLLGPVAAWNALRREGQGAGWPFLVCWVGLLTYVIGWKLTVRVEAVGEFLRLAARSGASIGASGWTYLMLTILIPICLIARGKPDYALEDAIRLRAARG